MNMNVKSIKFGDKDYTANDLEGMKVEDLTNLRNLIGVNLGGSRIQKFQTKAKGVTGCWHTLIEYEKAVADEDYTPVLCGPDGIAKSKVDVAGGMPKCDLAEVVKRPTKAMFYRVKKIGEPDKSQRPNVWGRYKDGMRVVDAMEVEGIHAGKIGWYVKLGLMELEDPGNEIIEKEIRVWYKKQGREYPGDAIEIAKKARAEAKAEREKTNAVKKVEREKATEIRKQATAEKKEISTKKKADTTAKKKAEADKAKAKLVKKSDKKKAKAA